MNQSRYQVLDDVGLSFKTLKECWDVLLYDVSLKFDELWCGNDKLDVLDVKECSTDGWKFKE